MPSKRRDENNYCFACLANRYHCFVARGRRSETKKTGARVEQGASSGE